MTLLLSALNNIVSSSFSFVFFVLLCLQQACPGHGLTVAAVGVAVRGLSVVVVVVDRRVVVVHSGWRDSTGSTACGGTWVVAHFGVCVTASELRAPFLSPVQSMGLRWRPSIGNSRTTSREILLPYETTCWTHLLIAQILIKSVSRLLIPTHVRGERGERDTLS